MAARTNVNEVLRGSWYCEHCHDEQHGTNPPDICEVCGHVYFENGLDVVSEGRPLPTRTRPVELEAR